MAKPISYIICGYEHGGTTLVSDIFRANGFESGFEGGVLLADQPHKMVQIEPYWTNLLSGWSITEDVRAKAVEGDFAWFYEVICGAAFPYFDGEFFDKTPKYMESLGACLYRAPFVEGAVVVHRDPRSVFLSMARRLSPRHPPEAAIIKNFDHLVSRYISYFAGSIVHYSSPKVLFVPFEGLVTNEVGWLDRLAKFTSKSLFRARQCRSRFKQVYSDHMESERAESHRILSANLQLQILKATAKASPFFSDDTARRRHIHVWHETREKAEKRLSQFQMPNTGVILDGLMFDPMTYLIRYDDVLESGMSPIDHFRLYGQAEGRLAC